MNDFLYFCPTCKTVYESSAIAFDPRPSRFATGASKACPLPTMTTGLPTGECHIDLSEQHSVLCSSLPATVVIT